MIVPNQSEKTDNELIAEFMGYGYERSRDIWENGEYAYTMKFSPVWNKWVIPSHMKFHTSWDWLMPVVEKIGDMAHDPNIPVPYTVEFKWELDKVLLLPICSHIQQVYPTVVKFIKWYNSQKK